MKKEILHKLTRLMVAGSAALVITMALARWVFQA